MKRTSLLFCTMLAISVAALGCGGDGDSGAAGTGAIGGAGGTGGTGGIGGTGGAEPTVPTQGLQAFLSFGGDATDQSGNGNDGTLGGGATVNGELVVGSNDTDYLSLPHTVMDGLTDFTFAAWVRLDTLRDESHELISGANAIEDNVLIFWYSEATGQWFVGVNENSTPFAMDSSIEDGAWHHIALVRSGAVALLYLDGAQLGGSVPIPEDALDIDEGGLIVGQDQDELGGGLHTNDSWAGAIDNLRIYDRALTSEEVQLVAAEPR
jgi:hypothetical protein